ncbi:MAG: hypothetical protein IJN54_05920 [Lachnospiraceae bacterium]|nr:hypothetical protein [Lachnospiraceae bacterium]
MREKLIRFMYGRYGNDQFNKFLMALSLICLVFSFFGADIFYLFAIMILIYSYFRMFSKNLYKRRRENTVYLQYQYKVKQFWNTQKRDFNQRKTHHIYKCPSCRQKIRIPKGKGKIEIRCPKCSSTFIKRS